MPDRTQSNLDVATKTPVSDNNSPSVPTAAGRKRYRPKITGVLAPSPAPAPMAVQAAGDTPEASAPQAVPAVPGTQNWALIVSVLFTATILAAFLISSLKLQVNLSLITSGFTVRFISLFVEAAPFLLLGSIAAGLIDTFVSPDHIARLVPSNRFLGVLMGTFAGFVFPVCECGVVPVVRQLYSKKLPAPVGLAFLMAAPVMNPIVLLSTWTAFGFGPVLIGRYAITAIVAIATGLVFSLRGERLELRQPQLAAPATTFQGALAAGEQQQAPLARIRSAMQVAAEEFFDMGRFLVVGSLLAAGMQTLVSQDVLASLGQGPFASVLTMQAVAFVLSVCSTVDAFLALAFAGTFTTGSLLAFLTFGPMVDIKTTTMFLGVFKRKTVIWLTVVPLVLTAIAGITLNLLGLQ